MPKLQYTGKKIPFTFNNPQLKDESPTWKERGEIIECSELAIQILTRGSSHDFKRIASDDKQEVVAPTIVEKTEDTPVTAEVHENDGDALFTDEQPAKRRPGRPPIKKE